jgi:hypothetical protein
MTDDNGRTLIGNTPTCEDCDQPQDECICEYCDVIEQETGRHHCPIHEQA